MRTATLLSLVSLHADGLQQVGLQTAHQHGADVTKRADLRLFVSLREGSCSRTVPLTGAAGAGPFDVRLSGTVSLAVLATPAAPSAIAVLWEAAHPISHARDFWHECAGLQSRDAGCLSDSERPVCCSECPWRRRQLDAELESGPAHWRPAASAATLWRSWRRGGSAVELASDRQRRANQALHLWRRVSFTTLAAAGCGSLSGAAGCGRLEQRCGRPDADAVPRLRSAKDLRTHAGELRRQGFARASGRGA